MDKESIYKRESSAIYTFKVGIAILQLFHTGYVQTTLWFWHEVDV